MSPCRWQELARTSWKKSVGLAFQRSRARARAQEQVDAVDLLPHLDRDLVAHHAGVLPRQGDGGDDGVRVILLEDEELGDGAPVRLVV